MLRRAVLSLFAVAAAAFTCLPENDPVECAALGDLYAATAGESWVFNTGWSNAASGLGTNLCDFYGVSCTSQGVPTQMYAPPFRASAHRRAALTHPPRSACSPPTG